jgi:hypothetical protein
VRSAVQGEYVVFNRYKPTHKKKRKHLNEKAFFEGREGFRVNSYNPYRPRSLEHKEWERGYNRQYVINLNKLNKVA